MSTRTMTVENFADLIGTGTVLIDWWASWCAPCRTFGPIYEAASRRHPGVTFAKVDTQAEQGLAAAFSIQSIPTLMVFRDGILLFRDAGVIPGPAMDELLARIAEIDMDAVRRKIAEAEAKRTKTSAA